MERSPRFQAEEMSDVTIRNNTAGGRGARACCDRRPTLFILSIYAFLEVSYAISRVDLPDFVVDAQTAQSGG